MDKDNKALRGHRFAGQATLIEQWACRGVLAPRKPEGTSEAHVEKGAGRVLVFMSSREFPNLGVVSWFRFVSVPTRFADVLLGPSRGGEYDYKA